MSLSKISRLPVSSFTTADTCDSFSFLYREIGELFGKAKVAVLTAGVLIGGKYLYEFGYHAARFLYIYYFESLASQMALFSKVQGSWAVILGATDHLGPEYARWLAVYGLNVVLISDDEISLKKLASTLATGFGVKVETILLDKTAGIEQFTKISHTIKTRWVGLLVNNWVVPPRVTERTISLSPFSEIEVKLAFFNLINKVCVESMLFAKVGAVITVTCSEADCVGFKLSPDIQYIHSYVEQQYDELTKVGLTIQHFQPLRCAIKNGSTDVPLSVGSSWRIFPTSQSYAGKSLKVLGTAFSTSGYWSHSLFAGIWFMIPQWGRPGFNKCIRTYT